jgi:hypothetical protein
MTCNGGQVCVTKVVCAQHIALSHKLPSVEQILEGKSGNLNRAGGQAPTDAK